MLKIILVSIMGILIIWLSGAVLYHITGLFRFFFHDILKWHEPDENERIYFDGCSRHATCKYCKEDIMQDSQGNWFN